MADQGIFRFDSADWGPTTPIPTTSYDIIMSLEEGGAVVRRQELTADRAANHFVRVSWPGHGSIVTIDPEGAYLLQRYVNPAVDGDSFFDEPSPGSQWDIFCPDGIESYTPIMGDTDRVPTEVCGFPFSSVGTKWGDSFASLSPHPIRISCGDTVPAQSAEIVSAMTMERASTRVRSIGGMDVYRTDFILSDTQKTLLAALAAEVTVLIVPAMMLQALRLWSDAPKNAVAYNATAGTQRSAPQDKIADITYWSA